jgi:glycine/D-amino acid oxidase-like deaminating enzyme/nitrite reductase/ring-hydroxylating ferredoxin subunit
VTLDPTSSYWRATARDRPVAPHLAGSVRADVVVVGGGIVGMASALLAVERGFDVVVVEAGRLGAGTTGGTTGKVTVQHGTRLADLRAQQGTGAAATYARANARGLELLDRLVADHGVACDLEVADACLVALTDRHADEVRAEAEATRAVGVPVALEDGVDELGLDGVTVCRVPDQRQVHAVDLLHGFADAVVAAGGQLYEHTRAVDLEPSDGPRRWALGTDRGRVLADHVVVATRLPVVRDRRLLFGRTKPVSAVGIAATLDGAAPRGMYLFQAGGTWSARGSRRPDGTEHLVTVGVSAMTGDRAALRDRLQVLERWTRGRFAVEEVTHGWMAQDQLPADGRPYVGALDGEGTWTATGFGKWGLALGLTAGERLVGAIAGDPDPYGGWFSTGRLERPAGWTSILRAGLRTAGFLAGDRVRARLGDDGSDLAPGEGRVVRRGRRPVAVARDRDGTLHRVAATCTHLGCLVRWNADEATWDCGCHGSRFAIDGTVLEAPAVDPLPPAD